MAYWRRCKNWCVLEFSHIAPMECSEYQKCEKHLRVDCAECAQSEARDRALKGGG